MNATSAENQSQQPPIGDKGTPHARDHRDDFESEQNLWRHWHFFGYRVAPGGFPPEAPTDPDGRNSRIRLLRSGLRDQPNVCFARVAIRCRFVDMLPSFEALALFPANGSLIRHPLPSTGSSRASSPASSVLWDALTPGRPSRRTSLPSLGGTASALRFRVSRRAATRALRARGFSDPVAPFRFFPAEAAGPPRFLENPNADMPCAQTPVGSATPGRLQRSRCGPPLR